MYVCAHMRTRTRTLVHVYVYTRAHALVPTRCTRASSLLTLLLRACPPPCALAQGHEAQVQALHALYNICKFNKKVGAAQLGMLGVVGVGREKDGHLMAGRSWAWWAWDARKMATLWLDAAGCGAARTRTCSWAYLHRHKHVHTHTHARTQTLSTSAQAPCHSHADACTHTHTHTHTPPWDHAESVAQSQGNGCPRRSFSHVTPAHARTPPPPGVRARRVQVHLEAAASEGAIPHLCRMAVAGVAASADPTTVAALKAASARSSAAGGGEQFTPVGASVRAFTPGGSSVRAFTPGCSGVRAFTPGVSGLCAFTPGGRSVLWTTRCELCPDCSAPPPTLPAGTSACSSARFRRGTLALARLPVGACCPCPLPSPPGSALAITTALAGMRWLALLSMPADVHCSHAHAHARLLPPPTAPPATLPPTALAHAQPPLPLPLPAAAARAVCCCRRAATLGLRARFCGAHAGGHGVVLASDARAHVERGRPGRPAGAARGTPGGGPGSSVCAHVHVCACAHACIYACVHVEPCVRATSTTHIHKRALLPAPACAQHYHAVPAAGRHAPLCIPPPRHRVPAMSHTLIYFTKQGVAAATAVHVHEGQTFGRAAGTALGQWHTACVYVCRHCSLRN